MLKTTIFFVFFFIFSSFGFSANQRDNKKQQFKNPPLSIFIQTDADRQNIVEVERPQKYINSLGEQVMNSILSPKEMWSVFQSESLEYNTHKYFELFYPWYLTELPIMILADKRQIVGDHNNFFDLISSKEFSEMSFLFDAGKPFTAEKMIVFADHYNYTYPEKLNLFLLALYKNISEEELFKLLKIWGIEKNIGVYIQDYKTYINMFFDKLDFSSEHEKDITLSIFNRYKQPITSVLHELINSNRVTLFTEMLAHSKVDINIQNYLFQTALHIAANKEGAGSETYVASLLKHPKINLNIPDFQGWTPVFYAIAQSRDHYFPNVKRFLAQKSKLDLNILDRKRKTLTLVASELGMPRVAQLLYEQGASLPKQVSLANTYMTNDYKTVWFQYKYHLHLNELISLFDLNERMPSFTEFQQISMEEMLMQGENSMWRNFKYYFLFQALQQSFFQEEIIREFSVKSVLFDNESGEIDKAPVNQMIRAVYQGDISALKRLFAEKNAKENLDPTSVVVKHSYTNWDKKAILDFHLLERINVAPLYQDDQSVLFYTHHSSLLSEAVRANQVKVVQFLLGMGEDPTNSIKNFVAKDSIVTAILTGGLLYKNKEEYKNHLRIIELLMSHPNVTRNFLNREVIPTINYADLAALTGHLPALKHIHSKGSYGSNEALLGVKAPIETISFTKGFLKQAIFILEEKIKKNPNDQELQNKLNTCKRAFN